jgi:hypothetical protein
VSATRTSRLGRRAAERIMVDACSIFRRDNDGTLNVHTGKVEYATTVVYAGKCRIKQETGTSVGDVHVGEAAIPSVRPIVHIPIGEVDVHEGDRVTVTGAVGNPALQGYQLLVRSIHTGTFNTVHKLMCEVIT